jgi:hypothetical protein
MQSCSTRQNSSEGRAEPGFGKGLHVNDHHQKQQPVKNKSQSYEGAANNITLSKLRKPGVHVPQLDDQIDVVGGWMLTELIFGRLAMAYFAGLVFAATTGTSHLDLLDLYSGNVAIISLGIVFPSLFVRRLDPGLEVRFLETFTLRAERWNGRLAMLGILILAVQMM